MGELIFVLGGARSGKSRFAEARAREIGGDEVLYVATAEVGDDEMRRRIEKHRQQRSPAWHTLEVTHDAGAAIVNQAGGARVVLVDCLSMLVANPLMADGLDSEGIADEEALEGKVRAEVAGLINAVDAIGASFIVVSNEVGMAVVPPSPLGRLYRDVLGRANQQMAVRAGEVYLVVAGIPMQLK